MSRLYKVIASVIIGITATFVSCRLYAEVVLVERPKLARSIPAVSTNSVASTNRVHVKKAKAPANGQKRSKSVD